MSAVRVRATHQVRRRCVQVAEHLAHDTPLSAFVAEVVCDVGGAAPRRALTDSKLWELRYTWTRA